MLSPRIRLAPSFAIAAMLLALFVFPVKPARAQVQTNTATSNLPTTRLKVSSNLVEVRVVVRDAQGKPVKGLRKEDFKLFDSGNEDRHLNHPPRREQFSLMKAAHVVVSSAARQEIRVRSGRDDNFVC